MADTNNVKLRDFGNPYAFIDENDDGPGTGVPLTVADSVQLAMPLAVPTGQAHFSDAGQSGNPYSHIGDDDESPNSASQRGLSRKDFETECRRILRQYTPRIEKNLRPHHREFITRNAAKPPVVRQRIVDELKKYDLSDIEGARSHFNKEDPFSHEKLLRIELEAENKK